MHRRFFAITVEGGGRYIINLDQVTQVYRGPDWLNLVGEKNQEVLCIYTTTPTSGSIRISDPKEIDRVWEFVNGLIDLFTP